MLRGHLKVCTVYRAPFSWKKRYPMGFFFFQCIKESFIAFHPWGLFSSVGVGEKQVGSACYPGRVEEDRSLGSSEVICTGYLGKMVCLRGG